MEQLPDISRPAVLLQLPQGFGGNMGKGIGIAAGAAAEVEMAQGFQIIDSIPERGNLEHHGGQPVKQVFPKLAGPDQLEGVLVAGRDHPHIHFPFPGLSHPAENTFLEYPEKLGLHGRTHGIQFVQEQGPFMGGFQQTFPVGGTGIGPGYGTEQDAFNEAFGNGGAVEHHQGLVFPAAQLVDALGQDFLAGARLSIDHDVAVLGSHLSDRLFQFLHGWSFSNEILQVIAALFLFLSLSQGQILGPVLELFQQLPPFVQEKHIFFKVDGRRQSPVLKDRMGGVEGVVFLSVHGFVPAEPVPNLFLFPDAGQGGAFF